jgi:hypothetical protein
MFDGLAMKRDGMEKIHQVNPGNRGRNATRSCFPHIPWSYLFKGQTSVRPAVVAVLGRPNVSTFRYFHLHYQEDLSLQNIKLFDQHRFIHQLGYVNLAGVADDRELLMLVYAFSPPGPVGFWGLGPNSEPLTSRILGSQLFEIFIIQLQDWVS